MYGVRKGRIAIFENSKTESARWALATAYVPRCGRQSEVPRRLWTWKLVATAKAFEKHETQTRLEIHV